MPITPTPSDLDIATDNQQAAVKEVLVAKYKDAGSWMTYGAGMLEGYLADIEDLLNAAAASNDLATVQQALANIELYVAPGVLTYNAPTAPTYDTVPTYTAPTLGTIVDIPAVAVIDVGAAPPTDVTFANSSFSDSFMDSLKSKLLTDMSGTHTGLGDAESALFARETARQNDARAKAYSEVTTALSSRNFDMPPGALLAKQTEINNESGIRLSDSSSQIMSESARLAVDYNKSILSNATQLLDLVARVFDSKIMRDFEAAKTAVQYAIEGFKQSISVALAKAELNKSAIAATVATNEGTVKVFEAQVEGQVSPIKAIADINQSKAGAYDSAVKASVAALDAQAIPEELKLKGAVANSQIAGTKADIAIKSVAMVIEQARSQLELKVQTLISLAGGAQQIIAGALNGVSVSSSFGFSGSVGKSYGISNNTSDSYGQGDHANPTLPRI